MLSFFNESKKVKQNWPVRKMLLELAFTVYTVSQFLTGESATLCSDPKQLLVENVKGRGDKEWAILLCQQCPFITTRN